MYLTHTQRVRLQRPQALQLVGAGHVARPLLLAGPQARRWRREGAPTPSRRGSEPPPGAGHRGAAPALAAARHGRRSRARLRRPLGRNPRTRPPLCRRGAFPVLPIGPRGAFPPCLASAGFSRLLPPPEQPPPHRAPAGMRQTNPFLCSYQPARPAEDTACSPASSPLRQWERARHCSGQSGVKGRNHRIC